MTTYYVTKYSSLMVYEFGVAINRACYQRVRLYRKPVLFANCGAIATGNYPRPGYQTGNWRGPFLEVRRE